MIVKEVWEGGMKVQLKRSDAVNLVQVEAVIEVRDKFKDLATQSIRI